VVVAGYATGSIPEVAGDTAELVPDHDWRALARATQRLLDEPERWCSLRRAGQDAARQRRWSAVAEQQVAMYEEMLHRGPGRRRTVPVSTGRTRAQAREEFGPPATALGQERPFALPVLRDRPRLAARLGRAVDHGTALAAGLTGG
jgi:hypothetical protein